MPITLEFPANRDPLEFLISFAPKFDDSKLRESLLGAYDSLRQAALIPTEPLALVACLTAEEEAACFLYYALLYREFPVPNYGRLQRHQDKIKVLITAITLEQYFFKAPNNVSLGIIRIEEADGELKATLQMPLGNYVIIVEDPLETIVTKGEGPKGHQAAIDSAIVSALKKAGTTPNNLRSEIDMLARRRNRSLYGSPDKKPRLQGAAGIAHFQNNCIAMIILGILVLNAKKRTPSLEMVTRAIFKRLALE